MDQGLEALIGLAGAHCDSLELFEFTEEVLDEVTPFVHLLVDGDRGAALLHLGNNDFGPSFVELIDDPVGVEGLVGDQGIKFDIADQRRNADTVVAVARQELEAHQIAKCIGEREDLGRPAASGFAYGLALSPPFAPWPCR